MGISVVQKKLVLTGMVQKFIDCLCMIILIDLNHFKQEGNNSPFKLLIPFMVSIEREMIVNCDCSSKTPNERAAI